MLAMPVSASEALTVISAVLFINTANSVELIGLTTEFPSCCLTLMLSILGAEESKSVIVISFSLKSPF